MRLDEVYAALASFSDDELRAFVAADRRRRRSVELMADRVLLGWLVRQFGTDPLTEARVRAIAAIREAGIAEPRPGRVAARRISQPLVVAISVFASTVALLAVLGHALAMTSADRSAAGNEAVSIGLAVYPWHGPAQSLILTADAALLRAKEEGRDRIVVASRRQRNAA